MKKLSILALLISLMIFFSASKVFAQGTVFKIGADRLSWNFDGNNIVLPSLCFQFENYPWKRVGIGFQVRKESEVEYEGYYLGPYVAYRSSDKFYLLVNGGVEFGISSTTYYSYEIKSKDGYLWQRWVYLAQPSYNGAGVYPFGTIGLGFSAKHIVFETGVKVQAMRLGIQESLFGPNNATAYSIRDGVKAELVPSAIVRVGFTF